MRCLIFKVVLFLSFGLFLSGIGAIPATAGNLFPPSNASSVGEGEPPTCPPNTVLVWSTKGGGRIDCADVSSMINTNTCDRKKGQAAMGIEGGSAICQNINTEDTCDSSEGMASMGIIDGKPVCESVWANCVLQTQMVPYRNYSVACPNGWVVTGSASSTCDSDSFCQKVVCGRVVCGE